ncbi:MAG: hypothetical protein ACK2T7_11875 [Anaerolineales bacterium]
MSILVGVCLLGEVQSPVQAQEPDENPSEVDHIVVSPEEAYLDKGHGQQFTAHAFDADGNQVEFNLVWATTGGTITQEGFYTASQGGCHQVFAIDEDSGVTGEATVVVSCGEGGETCLAVIPGRVTLHIGDQIQFEVYEKSAEGVGEPVSCGWYSSGGTVTEDGLFTAEQIGSFTVTAVELSSGRMGSAHVVVEEKLPMLPWWAYTMMGGEWFWVMGLCLGLAVGVVVYIYRRSRTQNN